MNNNHNETPRTPSVLASLRALIPIRPLDFAEALQIAELQAARLLELHDITDWPVPSAVVTDLPRIQVVRRDLPTSGMSYWNGRTWVIALNASEPATRQRFTLLHEYKHIIDHGSTDRLYAGQGRNDADRQAELAADYFAACALMPKRLIKSAWGEGLQRPTMLGHFFDVSPRAMDVRLHQLGLVDERDRCAPPSHQAPAGRTRGRYFRQAVPLGRSLSFAQGVAA